MKTKQTIMSYLYVLSEPKEKRMEIVSNIGVGLGDILAMHASIHVVAHNYILWDKVKLRKNLC